MTLRYKRLLALSAGLALVLAAASLLSTEGTSAAGKFKVNVGGGRNGISVEEFMPKNLTVNQGDTVDFANTYEELHTVTFLAGRAFPELIVPVPGAQPAAGPPKLMFNPVVAFPTAPSTATGFDGSAFAGSGLLAKGQTWSVTFTKQGAYKFICALHPGMEANVSVVAPGATASVPAHAEFEGQAQLEAAVNAGQLSAVRTLPAKTVGANGATVWNILNAQSVGQADVMRFIPARLQVQAGDTVVWDNPTLVPHTVSFLSGAAAPELVVPEPQAGGPPNLVVNPQVLFPVVSGPTYAGTGYVNSGFLGKGPEATGGEIFALTFTRPGTYTYICLLHADQGMAGVIEVTGSAVTPPSTGDAGLQSTGVGTESTHYLAGIALAVGLSGLLLVMRLRSR